MSIIDLDFDTLSGMTPLRNVTYSLGSNLGDRMEYLQGATDLLRQTPGMKVTGVSSVYETDPVGMGEDSGAFLNLVIVAETTLEPRTLLERAQAIEDAFGRERTGNDRWEPRTLDVDLIMVGNTVAEKEDLTLPHPLAHQRGFVLVPWAEVDPKGELPGQGQVADLAAAVGRDGVVRRDDLAIDRD